MESSPSPKLLKSLEEGMKLQTSPKMMLQNTRLRDGCVASNQSDPVKSTQAAETNVNLLSFQTNAGGGRWKAADARR